MKLKERLLFTSFGFTLALIITIIFFFKSQIVTDSSNLLVENQKNYNINENIVISNAGISNNSKEDNFDDLKEVLNQIRIQNQFLLQKIQKPKSLIQPIANSSVWDQFHSGISNQELYSEEIRSKLIINNILKSVGESKINFTKFFVKLISRKNFPF